jgi:hypothetical protein
MKTKQINPICTNCAHAELTKPEDVDGYCIYLCGEHNTSFLVDVMNNKVGKYGIWSKKCNYFKAKIS